MYLQVVTLSGTVLWIVGFLSVEGCDGNRYNFSSKCYGLLYTQTHWKDAGQFCQFTGGELATVYDTQTYYFLKEVLQTEMLYSYWIGIRRSKTIGYTVDSVLPGDVSLGRIRSSSITQSTFTYYGGPWVYDQDKTPLIRQYWGEKQPDFVAIAPFTASYLDVGCVALSAPYQLFWADEPCSYKYRYICQVPVSSENCCYKFNNDTCFYLSNDKFSFDDSRIKCNLMRGTLATPRTKAENDFLRSAITSRRNYNNPGGLAEDSNLKERMFVRIRTITDEEDPLSEVLVDPSSVSGSSDNTCGLLGVKGLESNCLTKAWPLCEYHKLSLDAKDQVCQHPPL